MSNPYGAFSKAAELFDLGDYDGAEAAWAAQRGPQVVGSHPAPVAPVVPAPGPWSRNASGAKSDELLTAEAALRANPPAWIKRMEAETERMRVERNRLAPHKPATPGADRGTRYGARRRWSPRPRG